jgi:uncharacterized RDD family membrane protein YckC
MRAKQLSIYFSLILQSNSAKLPDMTATHARTSPSLLRRLTAIIYDALLVIALVGLTNALALGIVVETTGGTQEVLGAHWVQLITVVCVVGFFSFFWLKSGQTLGMQAWRIKLVDFNGNPPSPGKAVMRCFGALLSASCLGLGYLWCLIDRNNRYWHDYLSRTELILLPKADKDKET